MLFLRQKIAFTVMADSTSYRSIITLAWPIILANASVPLLGIVDTAVVGHLPSAADIGAVAVGATIFSALYWGFGFLRMATGGFTAQAVGAGHSDQVRTVLAQAMLMAIVFGLACVALQAPVLWLAETAIGASEAVQQRAGSYFTIRVWSAPAALAQFALVGWFIGLKRTRTALVLQLFMNGVNIGLDLLFVPVFGWGIPGVAIATLIAEWSAFGVGLFLVYRTTNEIGGRWRRSAILNWRDLRRTMGVNANIFVRTACLIFGFAYFTAFSARLGDQALAANAVLLHVLHLQAYGMDGFAHAAEILVGNAYGAGDKATLRRAVFMSGRLALATAVLASLATWIGGEAIIAVMTDQQPIRNLAAGYLGWLIAAPLLGIWAFHLDGVFVGVTFSREMRNAAIMSLLIYGIGVWILPLYWQNHGLWLAVLLWLLARAVTLALYYPRIERAAAARAPITGPTG